MLEFVYINCSQALENLPEEENHVSNDPHISDSASPYREDLSDVNSVLESQVFFTLVSRL